MLSRNTSPMATRRTFLQEVRQSATAPVPRPPQPIRAIFNSSPPAIWAACAMFSPPAKAMPAAAAVVPFKNSRREGFTVSLMGVLVSWIRLFAGLRFLVIEVFVFFEFGNVVARRFFGARDAQRTQDPKADEVGVGEIPDALGDLRIGRLPLGARRPAGGAPQPAAPRRSRPRRGRPADRPS